MNRVFNFSTLFEELRTQWKIHEGADGKSVLEEKVLP